MNPTDKKDLLNSMLFGKDPVTGEGLSDDNIRNNVRVLFSPMDGIIAEITGSSSHS